jgi:hypothetical protein
MLQQGQGSLPTAGGKGQAADRERPAGSRI